MTLDDEIKLLLNKSSSIPAIIEDWEEIADTFSDAFTWAGAKINWETTVHHKTAFNDEDHELLTSISSFIDNKTISEAIKESRLIYYINDSSLNFSIAMNTSQFYETLPILINNVPQHHYFFDEHNKWVLVISAEGFIDFGFSAYSSAIKQLKS